MQARKCKRLYPIHIYSPVYLNGVSWFLHIKELWPCKTTTRGVDIYTAVKRFFVGKKIPLENLVSVTIDKAPAMMGWDAGFIALCRGDRLPKISTLPLHHSPAGAMCKTDQLQGAFRGAVSWMWWPVTTYRDLMSQQGKSFVFCHFWVTSKSLCNPKGRCITAQGHWGDTSPCIFNGHNWETEPFAPWAARQRIKCDRGSGFYKQDMI